MTCKRERGKAGQKELYEMGRPVWSLLIEGFERHLTRAGSTAWVTWCSYAWWQEDFSWQKEHPKTTTVTGAIGRGPIIQGPWDRTWMGNCWEREKLVGWSTWRSSLLVLHPWVTVCAGADPSWGVHHKSPVHHRTTHKQSFTHTFSPTCNSL